MSRGFEHNLKSKPLPETKEVIEIEVIKMKLTESCRYFKPLFFLPFLLSPKVRVGFSNKVRFYSCFKDTLNSAKTRSEGELDLKIERESWEEDEDMLAYNFYDQVHLYPRINLRVKEKENFLFIDIMPF